MGQAFLKRPAPQPFSSLLGCLSEAHVASSVLRTDLTVFVDDAGIVPKLDVNVIHLRLHLGQLLGDRLQEQVHFTCILLDQVFLTSIFRKL